MAKQATCDIGLIGLAVMGENLALNIASRGYSIAVYNRTGAVTDAFVKGRGNQPHVVGCHTLADLVARNVVVAPRRRDDYRTPMPITVHSGARIDQLLREVRG